MSINTGLIPDHPERMSKKSHHRKTDSDEELDVFEAAKYFSGTNEMHVTPGQVKAGKDYVQEKIRTRASGRLSLDMPSRSSLITSNSGHVSTEKKKQPSSPGGKLAHFLNNLFNQNSSRKKKSKSITTTQSAKDHEDQSPGWRRKRRSSISHFQSATANSAADSISRSVYPANSGSGFRTPPPVKSYKEFRSFSDQYQSTAKQETTIHVKSVPEKKINLDYAWLDEKFRFSNQDLPINNNRVKENAKTQAKNWPGFHGDDGADSDSSSDLFELPNYDLDFCSSGLPVYETTNMNSIKRCSAPIATAAR